MSKLLEPSDRANLIRSLRDAVAVEAARQWIEVDSLLDMLTRIAGYLDKDGETPGFVFSGYYKVDSPQTWACKADGTMNVRANAHSSLGWTLEAEISWSSTGRDLAHATLALANYRRAVEFGAFVECLFSK